MSAKKAAPAGDSIQSPAAAAMPPGGPGARGTNWPMATGPMGMNPAAGPLGQQATGELLAGLFRVHGAMSR